MPGLAGLRPGGRVTSSSGQDAMGPRPENGAISRRAATAIKALRVKALIGTRPALIRFRLWRFSAPQQTITGGTPDESSRMPWSFVMEVPESSPARSKGRTEGGTNG